MAYSPTVWNDNNEPAISADKLNHAETGIKDAHDSIDTINTIIENLTTYSLDEINTEIKWVDGNDIFKKTIYISSLPNATTAVYDTTITNMQEFIYLYGRASGGLIVNGVRPDSRELEIGAWYDETQDKIRVATGIDRRSIAAYITILYTKATDEVVSNE